MTTVIDVFNYIFYPLWHTFFAGLNYVFKLFLVDIQFLGFGIGWYLLIGGIIGYVYLTYFEKSDPIGFANYYTERKDYIAKKKEARELRKKFEIDRSHYRALKDNEIYNYNKKKLNELHEIAIKENKFYDYYYKKYGVKPPMSNRQLNNAVATKKQKVSGNYNNDLVKNLKDLWR